MVPVSSAGGIRAILLWKFCYFWWIGYLVKHNWLILNLFSFKLYHKNQDLGTEVVTFHWWLFELIVGFQVPKGWGQSRKVLGHLWFCLWVPFVGLGSLSYVSYFTSAGTSVVTTGLFICVLCSTNLRIGIPDVLSSYCSWSASWRS